MAKNENQNQPEEEVKKRGTKKNTKQTISSNERHGVSMKPADTLQIETAQTITVREGDTDDYSLYADGIYSTDLVSLERVAEEIQEQKDALNPNEALSDKELVTDKFIKYGDSSVQIGLLHSGDLICKRVSEFPRESMMSDKVVFHKHKFSTYTTVKDYPIWENIDDSKHDTISFLERLIIGSHDCTEVLSQFLKWLEDPQKTLSILESLLEGKIRYGRDVYKDTNYKFTKVDLFNKLNSQFSSVSSLEHKSILTALVLKFIELDIKPAGYMRDNMKLVVPVRTLPSGWVSQDVDGLIKHELLLRIIEKYQALSTSMAEKALSNSELFKNGTIILESDLEDWLVGKRRALQTLVYDYHKTTNSLNITRSLVAVKIHGVILPNHDYLAPLLEYGELDDLASNISFSEYSFINGRHLYDAMTLTKLYDEVKRAVQRVHDLFTRNRFLQHLPIESFKEKIYFQKSYDALGNLCGAFALHLNDYVTSSYLVAAPVKSPLSPALRTYETKSFEASTQVINSLEASFSILSQGTEVLSKISELNLEKMHHYGLCTNLSEFALHLLAISIQGGYVYFERLNTEPVSLEHFSELTKLPRIVYPTLVLPEHRVHFLDMPSIAAEVAFLSPSHFLIAQQDFLENKIPDIKKVDTKFDSFTLYNDYLKTIENQRRTVSDTEIKFSIDVDGIAYDTEFRVRNIIGDEVLFGSHIYRDSLNFQLAAYNYAVYKEIRQLCINTQAHALGIESYDQRWQYGYRQKLILLVREVTAKSMVFQKLLANCVRSVLAQAASEKRVNLAAFIASRERLIKNQIGVKLLVSLNNWLHFVPSIIMDDIVEAIEDQLKHNFEEIF